MGLDLTGIGQALGGLFSTIKPVVEEHYAQKYENDHKDRLDEFHDIMDGEDSPERAGRIDRFVERLCDAASSPSGDVSGRRINIPLSHFTALINIASGKVKDDQLLARLQFKQN